MMDWAIDEAVEMVSVEVPGAPLNVTDAGENAHAAPAGNPEQASVTVPLDPPLGVRVSVVVAEPPGATEPEAGLALRLKSSAAPTVSATALEVLVAKTLSPL